MRMTAMALALVTASWIPNACADPIAVSGYVSRVWFVGGASQAPGNYDFRVFLQGNSIQCNGQNWSYVNVTDPNYKGVVAGILAARAANISVILHVIQDGAGYCQIGYIES